MTDGRRPPTPAQTVGPFLSLGLAWPQGSRVVHPARPGAVRISGGLFDGNGEPVGDGMIETWQLGPGDFRGFGRCLTTATGTWEILTLKPDPLATADGATEAPHLDVLVFARGLLHRLVTRIYFADEEKLNTTDPVLSALPDDAARATLVARRSADSYQIDIHLQGTHETVFFAV